MNWERRFICHLSIGRADRPIPTKLTIIALYTLLGHLEGPPTAAETRTHFSTRTVRPTAISHSTTVVRNPVPQVPVRNSDLISSPWGIRDARRGQIMVVAKVNCVLTELIACTLDEYRVACGRASALTIFRHWYSCVAQQTLTALNDDELILEASLGKGN